jgi:hypothetical protein
VHRIDGPPRQRPATPTAPRLSPAAADVRAPASSRPGRRQRLHAGRRATHAALLLAQGSGRLIHTTIDRGVVACLDPRLVTARYDSFLRASLPPMWQTEDRALLRNALGARRRLIQPCYPPGEYSR